MKFLLLLFILPVSLLAEKADPLRIHFISGSKEYNSAESLGKLKDHLEENHSVSITTSMATDKAKDLPNVEKVQTTDVLVVFAGRLLHADLRARAKLRQQLFAEFLGQFFASWADRTIVFGD